VLAQVGTFDRKNVEGFPPAAKQLGVLEAKAAKTGKSPRAFKKAPTTQTARLPTVLAEFNPNANDDFSGFERPAAVGSEDVNLTPYAGSTIGLRLRDATDAAFEAPGWFADDFEVTATDTEGAGWIITSAPSSTSSTTWPSGATTTASTRACATPTTPPASTRAASGGSPASPTTPPACSSGTGTPSTP